MDSELKDSKLVLTAKITFPDNASFKATKPPEIPGVEYKNREINLEMPLNGLLTEQNALLYVGVYCLKNSGFKKEFIQQFFNRVTDGKVDVEGCTG